jgi:hypothetical protein
MSCFYAGIGSRETPAAVRARFFMLAKELGEAGWTLRSGGAEGADQAFESGLEPHHPREIYLPWPGFSGNRSRLFKPTTEAFELAKQFHPAWERCSAAARRMHARNMHQVLGQDLASPAELVVCWTPDGRGGGGTGQAIRLAKSRDIPIFDFGRGPQMHGALQAWLATRNDSLRAAQLQQAALPAADEDDAPQVGCGP